MTCPNCERLRDVLSDTWEMFGGLPHHPEDCPESQVGGCEECKIANRVNAEFEPPARPGPPEGTSVLPANWASDFELWARAREGQAEPRAERWKRIAEEAARSLWDVRAYLKNTDESPGAVEQITDSIERLQSMRSALDSGEELRKSRPLEPNGGRI